MRLIICWSVLLGRPLACGAHTATVNVCTFCWPAFALTSVSKRNFAISSIFEACVSLAQFGRQVGVTPRFVRIWVSRAGFTLESPPVLGLPLEMKMMKFLAQPSRIGLL